uniref:Phage tail protein n=1 Tax=Heterorhabditis bacteriophora TaxID=37862 RepID=A0A1I7X4G5_HETBA
MSVGRAIVCLVSVSFRFKDDRWYVLRTERPDSADGSIEITVLKYSIMKIKVSKSRTFRNRGVIKKTIYN